MSKTANSELAPSLPDNPGAETRIALSLSLIWLLACGLYLIFVPGVYENATRDVLGMVIHSVAVGFPLVLIWTVSYVSGSIRSIRAESIVLRSTLDQIRGTLENRPAGDKALDSRIQKRLDEIASKAEQTEEKLAALAAKAEGSGTEGVAVAPLATAALKAAPTPPSDDNQTSLPLQTPDGPARVPISISEFIKALNFPDNAEDREGFRVLRRAFEERELGKLLQASQDVLTLLSQDGIYMDDLNPDKPLPGVWRKFADGERGLSVVALGGIRDRSALTLAKARLKNDPIFRDATHHFLRQFDIVLIDFEKTASDENLIAMTDTRSARAFMLLGRVAGSFD